MKVLFLVSTFPALSETFILNQITGFIQAGCDVEILAMSKATGKVHPDIARYQLMEKVRFINVPKSFQQKIVRLCLNMIKHPIKTLKWLNIFRYGKFALSLRPLLVANELKNQAKYDAIIAHYGSNGLILSILESYSKAKRFVFLHGNDLTGFVNRFGYRIYKPLFASNVILLPISELWAQKVQDYGAKGEQLQVHHMGVDTEQFSQIPLVKFKQTVQLLLIGRLTEKKGIDMALSSLYLLKGYGYSLSLTIIGDGEMRMELENLTKELGLEKNVHFTGWLDQAEVKTYIQKADIILQPSRTAENGDMEGIPVALMEALAQGKLVVSTFHSGIPELITDGYNGLLAPENDVVIFTNQIERLLKMSEKQRQMLSENARSTIEKEFCIETLNKKLLSMCAEK